MWPTLCGMGPCQHRRDQGLASQLPSQLLIPGPVAESAPGRDGCPVGLPLWPGAELPSGAAPPKPAGCWPGPRWSLCWCSDGCVGDILHSGGLPDSTPIFQGGWLPGPLSPCSPGFAGCAGRQAPCTLPSGKQCIHQSRRPRRYSTRLQGLLPTLWRGLESREQLKAVRGQNTVSKATGQPGPGWPSEPRWGSVLGP